MSKKNNKGTKKRVHAADLARERADASARAAKRDKRAAREARRQEEESRKSSSSNPLATPSLHATSGGRVLKKQKRNSLARAVKRVKKGSRVNGIRVVDAETKAAARAAVRAAAALAMEVDDDGKKQPSEIKREKTKKKAASTDKVMADA